MEPNDPGSPGEEPAAPETTPRPWGPGSPAPGAPVAGYHVGRDDTASLRASTASTLYENARFPELEDVAPPKAPPAARPAPDAEETEAQGLRILGSPAPREIAGPVLAALALIAALYGWRRRRRRRRG